MDAQGRSFKVACIALPVPTLGIAAAFVSIAIGRGQAVMLPGTVGGLAIVGFLVAIGAAWHDLTPYAFGWIPKHGVGWFPVAVAGALVLAAAAWFAAMSGTPGIVWRPAIAPVACLWFGIVCASSAGPVVRIRE